MDALIIGSELNPCEEVMQRKFKLNAFGNWNISVLSVHWIRLTEGKWKTFIIGNTNVSEFEKESEELEKNKSIRD